MSLRRVVGVCAVTTALVAQSMLWPFSAYAESINSDIAEIASENGEVGNSEGADSNVPQDNENTQTNEPAAKEEDSTGDLGNTEENPDDPTITPDKTEPADKPQSDSDQTNESPDASGNDEAETPAEPEPEVTDLSKALAYSAHVSGRGWLDPVDNGGVAGTTGQSLSLEALRVEFAGMEENAVSVRTHVSGRGWLDPVGNGGIAGTTGQALAVEALSMELSSELSSSWSIWYRVHSAGFGWLGWAHDGQDAGSAGYARAVQAVQIVVLPVDEQPDGQIGEAFRNHADEPPSIQYSAHVSGIGWMSQVTDGGIAGTVGRGLPLEALNAGISWYGHGGGIEFRSHVSGYGWRAWAEGLAGTTGQARQLEALQVRLTGEVAESYDVWYRVHVAGAGWLGWASDGVAAGTTGKGLAVQAVEMMLLPKGSEAPGDTANSYVGGEERVSGSAVSLSGVVSASVSATTTTIGNESGPMLRSISANVDNQIVEGSISYRGLIRGSGWQENWSADNAQINKENNGLQLQAIQMHLDGNVSEKYDLWYRAFDSEEGWLGWASNGASAGVEGGISGVYAVQVALVAKGGSAPGSTANAFVSVTQEVQLSYQAHVEAIGWQESVADGQVAGTTGKGLAIQALRAEVLGATESGSVQVSAHVDGIGWQGFTAGGTAIAGTVGQSRSMQAVKVQLTGDLANSYDIYYRVHSSGYGWLGWTSNGGVAGTTGLGLAAEAIEMKLVPKGEDGPTSNTPSSVVMPILSFSTHVQTSGWTGDSGSGGVSGTMGLSRRIEGLKMSITSDISGGIAYRAHVQGIGWQSEVSDGQLAGTTGQGKRVEAVRIRLTGDLANYFDVWYRTYVEGYGWLGWTRNGSAAGTGTIGYRMEAIQVQITPRGTAAPGSTSGAYTEQPVMPVDQLEMLQRANWYGSATQWLLMVNNTTCRVGVYRGFRGNWQPVFYWQCSPGKASTPTVLGEYTVTGKGYVFGHGYSCYYYTQFYGDYLFHSVLYDQGTFNIQDGRLGQNLSHGCVRLSLENAKWIYDNIPYGTKVVSYR